MDQQERIQLDGAANNLRVLIASMVEKAKSGHPGVPWGLPIS